MLWGTLVLLVVAIVVVVFVLQPLWVAQRRSRGGSPLPAALLDLFAERDVVLAALRDLELDFETGKVAGDEYRKLRAALVAEAARILQAIEEIDRALETSIEEEIAQLRALAKQIEPSSSTSTAGVST
ncbi:MAG: hypothetical protein RMK01_00440 [Thermomicrobium sp.]|nr:hypothetical protein [Thermomicrobium sp.]MDW8058521.1 hypothetical protein [Thermomicrobium sp.]